MMKRINPDKMTKAELDRLGAAAERVTYRYTRPLTAHDRQALARAARKGRGGRPRIGAGSKRINITVEQTLLTDADAYARKNGLTRAAVVAEGLKRLLAA
jgi:hypothetical protein